jgi:hypothetical protein
MHSLLLAFDRVQMLLVPANGAAHSTLRTSRDDRLRRACADASRGRDGLAVVSELTLLNDCMILAPPLLQAYSVLDSLVLELFPNLVDVIGR